MKIFLDVGAHIGQTLTAAQRWEFDRIVCFEPASVNWQHLRELADARTTIEPFGLWDKDADMPLYDVGSQGASLWKRPNRSTKSEKCRFRRATTWLRENTHDGDTVWMKLNAEGAELDIITDMLDSGAFERVSFIEVMWDSHKIPAVAARLAGVRKRLEDAAPPPRVLNSKMVPPALTHVARIDNWLTMTGATKR